jgi:ABC-type Na+ efflux pump permease subunit
MSALIIGVAALFAILAVGVLCAFLSDEAEQKKSPSQRGRGYL